VKDRKRRGVAAENASPPPLKVREKKRIWVWARRYGWRERLEIHETGAIVKSSQRESFSPPLGVAKNKGANCILGVVLESVRKPNAGAADALTGRWGGRKKFGHRWRRGSEKRKMGRRVGEREKMAE